MEPDPDRDPSVWLCTGPCKRSFHWACDQPYGVPYTPGTQPPAVMREALQCNCCVTDTHPCFICGQAGPGRAKCSMAQCARCAWGRGQGAGGFVLTGSDWFHVQ